MSTLPSYDGTQLCTQATRPQMDAFTGHPLGDIDGAKALCRHCPYQPACDQYAVHHDVRGIWGGRDDREREQARRQAHITSPRPVSDDLDDLVRLWRSAS
jgi:hypothetical protein